ncbi:MAG: MBL fold metallo-hydrolase [Candidatus Hodarchaeota archaeon]
MTMSLSELIPGLYIVRGKFADEFGFISSYLIVDNDSVLVIDPGTAGHPGDRITSAVKSIGLNPKSDIIGILCTHGHPDHVGGVFRLNKATGAHVMIHRNDAGLLEDPSTFIKERLSLDFAERLQMKLDKQPLRVNYKGLNPDRLIEHGDRITVGEVTLRVILTGGHSSGHCAFYEEERKILFSGDEVNNFPNDPRKFYMDLSGNISAKSAALSAFMDLGVEYLLPSHDTPVLFNEVRIIIEQVRDSVIHFQDSILYHLGAREEADVEQLMFDIRQARSIPIPTSYPHLLGTTIQVVLWGLEKAGLARETEKGVWSVS